MSKVIKECNGCASTEKGHHRPAGTNGHLAYDDCTEVDAIGDAGKQEADDLLERLRAANKQIVLQSQRIEELEAYLHCIVSLSAKVRELELDASL